MKLRARVRPWLLLLLVASACSGKTEATIDAGIDANAPDAMRPPAQQTTFGGERPAELLVPIGYDGATPLPLLMVLHGHGATGALQLAYTRLASLVDDRSVLVIAPDGLTSADGNQYWNATPACCDFDGSGVDDSAYLRKLIDDIRSVYNVDAKRIFLFGHSNGGFMAYRMACDHADILAGIISLAGATFAEMSQCSPSEAVHVLQIHGEADTTVRFAGGSLCADPNCAYPSVDQTLSHWANYNGCATTRTTASTRLDLDGDIAGDDTRVEEQDGCPHDGSVSLWAIEGGAHIPILRNDFDDQLWNWMVAHPRP